LIKALMIITMVTGAEYTAKLPDMDTCMKQISPVVAQNDVQSAACIPRTDNTDKSFDASKMKTFLEIFLEIVNKMEAKQPNYQPEYKPFPWFERSDGWVMPDQER
jgi:hypothetical protein